MYLVLYRVLVGSIFELCQDLKVSVHTQNCFGIKISLNPVVLVVGMFEIG